MGRRTSGASVGLEKIGNVQANQSTLTTTQPNTNITISPNGTGVVVNTTPVSITNQQALRLLEATSNGTDFLGMRASASMAASYTITWPAAVSAASGYVLTSDTSGNLSWTSPSTLAISVSDPGASATVHYPIFATNAGSVPSSLSPNARSNLSFVPSTGELTTTAVNAANVYGSTSSSGTLTIRGTSNGTKATASVLMTDNVSSSSTSTGTLVITGGLGVSGRISTTDLNVATSGALSFNNQTRQMINLFSTSYGIGIQSSTQYFRTDGRFSWFRGGVHSDTENTAGTGGTLLATLDSSGHFVPGANNAQDLGTSSLRWRILYTQDLELSNGIGDYTIVEGEDDLFIYNNKKGKVYKFMLAEVDPSQAPAKMVDRK